MFGMTERELSERGRAGVVDADDRRLGQTWAERQRKGVIANREMTYVRKNGERFPGETTSVILPGDPPRAFVIVKDITERKRAQERLQAALLESRESAVKLAEANRVKDDFLATLSHELRTPMNAVVGWAHMLASGKLDRATAERGIQAIVRNAQAQMQLISDILDVSRIVSGRVRLNVVPVDLAAVIHEAVDAVRPAAEAKSIALGTAITVDAAVISGDADRLQQVLWNLLSNAVKFTPAGGRVDVSLQVTGSQFVVAVSDNGIGIAPSFLPHVFDRFTQQDASPARRHGGLGLGLSIVRHLVELHGGTAEAASEGEGTGTTFTIKLPVRAVREGAEDQAPPPAPPADAPAAPDIVRPLAGLRVLVVDDEQDARDLLWTVLAGAGAAVVTRASAAEGLEQLRRESFDVLVADIGMPGEDGYQFVGKVRVLGQSGGPAIPAIALTAYDRPGDADRALASGFQMHLGKPVVPDVLVSTVARLAHARRER
jgi:signal transduction histidine kinase/ActR/RegA family two-component response regulator